MFFTTKQKQLKKPQKAPRIKIDPDKVLTPEQKKRIVEKVKLAKKKGKIPRFTQQTIPYQQIFKDGLCKVSERYYSKTIQFFDTNYQLAKKEDKDAIFESWCEFLNYFDNTISVQLSFVNQEIDQEEFYKAIEIPAKKDNKEHDELRKEFSDILKNQFSKGNNHLAKVKYITFGMEAETLAAAKMKLERIENEILNNFKMVGVAACTLDGYERLVLMHNILNAGTPRKLAFNWDLIVNTGLSTKDFIAPDSFDFRDKAAFRIGRRMGSVSWLQILAPELSDRMLSEFLELSSSEIVTMHIKSVDQAEAIKQVKGVLTDIQMMKITEQMKAARSGYDMDILPPDLVAYADEAADMLESLQSRNERMFLVTVLMLNDASSRDVLEDNISAAQSVAIKYNCKLRPLDFQQENGLASSLPLGLNTVDIKRILTTSATAVFVPFTTQEIFQSSGVYYGVNALSNNIVMADRKLLKNPNGLILGTPGSGKSFSSKREITNVILVYPDDDVLIGDPEREYSPLVSAFGGQIIRISADSAHHINIMDINLMAHNDEDTDYNPLTVKSDFIMSVCEQIMGGRNGLQPIEKTLIDRSVLITYREYIATPIPENMPTWGTLYQVLREQPEPEAQRLAGGMELYVMGSLRVFNNLTNVDINNRLVAFDTKDLGKNLQKLGMLIVQDQVWNRVTINRSAGRSTWAYYDEFHLMLREEQTAASSVEIWKRFRKWGGIPTGITQNVTDLLQSREISNIFSNSDFVYLLNQSAEDRAFLARQLGISPHQLSYVTNAKRGTGLLVYDGTIIPFVDEFPKETKLYRLMSTKPNEVYQEKVKNQDVPKGDKKQ